MAQNFRVTNRPARGAGSKDAEPIRSPHPFSMPSFPPRRTPAYKSALHPCRHVRERRAKRGIPPISPIPPGTVPSSSRRNRYER